MAVAIDDIQPLLAAANEAILNQKSLHEEKVAVEKEYAEVVAETKKVLTALKSLLDGIE